MNIEFKYYLSILSSFIQLILLIMVLISPLMLVLPIMLIHNFVFSLIIVFIAVNMIPVITGNVLDGKPHRLIQKDALNPVCERYGFMKPEIQVIESEALFFFPLVNKICMSSAFMKNFPEKDLTNLLIRELYISQKGGSGLNLLYSLIITVLNRFEESVYRISNRYNAGLVFYPLISVISILSAIFNFIFKPYLNIRERLSDFFYLNETGKVKELISALTQYIYLLCRKHEVPETDFVMDYVKNISPLTERDCLDIAISIEKNGEIDYKKIRDYTISSYIHSRSIMDHIFKKVHPGQRFVMMIKWAEDKEIDLELPIMLLQESLDDVVSDNFFKSLPVFAVLISIFSVMISGLNLIVFGIDALFIVLSLIIYSIGKYSIGKYHIRNSIYDLKKHAELGLFRGVPVILKIKTLLTGKKEDSVYENLLISDGESTIPVRYNMTSGIKYYKEKFSRNYDESFYMIGYFRRDKYPVFEVTDMYGNEENLYFLSCRTKLNLTIFLLIVIGVCLAFGKLF